MDLTSQFIASRELLKKYSLKQYLKNLLTSSKNTHFILDWDVDDGERMGRFFYKEELVAVFYSYLPLIFAKDFAKELLIAGFEKYSMECPIMVEVLAFEKKYLSANEEVKNFIDWNSDAVTIEKFSINDLYYAGV